MKLPEEIRHQTHGVTVLNQQDYELIVRYCAQLCIVIGGLSLESWRYDECADAILASFGLQPINYEIHDSPTDNPRQVIPHRSGGGHWVEPFPMQLPDKDVTPSRCSRHFDGMCWPAPGEALRDLQWTARYGNDLESKRFVVASVLDAYVALVNMTAKRRNEIIRELRKGPGMAK